MRLPFVFECDYRRIKGPKREDIAEGEIASKEARGPGEGKISRMIKKKQKKQEAESRQD